MEEAAQAGGQSPCLLVVQKRLRAAKKKLTRIQELEVLQASGKELSLEQVPTVKSKPAVLAVIEELQKVDESLKDAIKEEQAAAYARGVAYAQAEAHAQATAHAQAQAAQAAADLADMQIQLQQLTLNHTNSLSEAHAQHQVALQEQQQRLHAEAETAKEDAAKMAAAAALEGALREALSSSHPLKDLVVEPVRKLLTLMYFSQLFDVHRNPWVAPTEMFACLQYDAQADRAEGQAALSELSLVELAYFGRTLVDRMSNLVSHQQFLAGALDTALAWVLQPDAIIIPSPPAPTPVTVGELQSRVARVFASQFSQVVPATPDPMATMLPPPAAVPYIAPSSAGAAFPAVPQPLPPAPAVSSYLSTTSGQSSAPVSAAATTAPAPPIHPLLPSFLDHDATDSNAAQTQSVAQPAHTGKANIGSSAASAPAQAAPTHVVASGMYVLSASGVPELQTGTALGAAPQAPSVANSGSDTLSDLVRSKASLSAVRPPANPPRPAGGPATASASGPAGDFPATGLPFYPAQAGGGLYHNNGGMHARGPPPGVAGRMGGTQPAQRPWGRGQGRGRGTQE